MFDGCIDDGRRLLDKLERKGVVPRRARSVISCVGTMNRAFERGTNKFVMDLSMFERLLLDAQAAFGCELQAVCGMVGGLRRYGSYFQHFTDRTVEVLREEAGVSSYRIDGIGDVCFEVDADAGHLPVGLASMLGKYVREVAVERQTRFYRNHDGELPRASGYRDPVTRKFVTSSLDLRVRLGIADACFERRS